jgi:hypothetical protein
MALSGFVDCYPLPEALVSCKRPIMHRHPRPSPLGLLDFHLALLQIARKTSFTCWIFVGFRVCLNTCSTGKMMKTTVDLLVRVVGGDGFEPPTPAL